MKRPLAIGVVALALATATAGCGSSGGNAGPDSTTSTKAAGATTTTQVAETTTSTSAAETTTTGPTMTTTTFTTKTPDALPPCQDLLQEYTDVFTPDDLLPAALFFRKYAPLMPAEVKAASLRIAAAYEAADGDMSNLNFDDQDLTADATAFSDWTAAGCPTT